MTEEVRLQDVARACHTHVSRVSEALSALGAGPGCRGRAGATISVAVAIRAATMRKFMDLGLPAAAAADVARQVGDDDLTTMVAEDRATWLAVTPDPQDPDRFVFAVLGIEDVREIAAGPSSNVRLVNLYALAKAVFGAVLERKRSAATKETAAVTSYTAKDRSASGIILDNLQLAIVEKGRGKRIALTPEQARELATRLLAAAARNDPGGLN